jgi:UDP-glucose 4-epimerase
VVHLAARPSVPRSLADPVTTHEINATGTLNVLEACRIRAGHLVVASSSSVYGAAAELPKHEELAARPLSPYAASKLATEAYALAYGAAFGIPVQVFRFFNVYGPLQSPDHAYAAVVPAFVSAALHDRPLTIYGDGTQTRDFTYVGTVAQVLAEAVAMGVTSDTPVNLAFGSRVSLLDLVERLSLILGCPLAVEHRPARPGDVRDSQASIDRLRRLFPTIRPVDLEDGLRATVRWLSRTEFARSGPSMR